MTATLTKRERVLRTVRFEETDRVPCYDILENDAVIEHYAGERLTPENGRRVKGLAIGRVLDMTRMPYGPWAPRRYRREDDLVIQQERWTSWIVERPFDDVPSLKVWIYREIDRVNAAISEPAAAVALREQVHAEVRDLQRCFARGAPTSSASGGPDPTVLVLESGVGLTEMYWVAGMELFSYLMADDPGLVDAWLEARNQAELRRVAAIADPDLIPVALTYDDLAYKTGLLFSPRWLRRLWLPRLKRLVDAWHARDTTCLFHSDGNLWTLMDDLVEAGIDGLNPLEVLAGMSVRAVRERYPELFLTGGIDVSQLLPYGDPDEVRAVCRQTIADAGGVGYFLGSTTELHWDVKLDNAIAMFDIAHSETRTDTDA